MRNLEDLVSSMPDYAKDVKINIQNIVSQNNQALSAVQVFGSALACAYATKDEELIKSFEGEALNTLSESEMKAAKTAAVLMAMNNIYYRFTHLLSDKEYSQMPAGLRMKGIADHGINKVDFEVFSLAVSVLNGCGMCVDAHANQLLGHGFSKTQVQAVAKIASVVNSLAQAVVLERSLK